MMRSGITISLCFAMHQALAGSLDWQQEVDDAKRAAANGDNTALVVRPGSSLAASWPIGTYVFYNAPQPFCYAYVVPGEWIAVPGQGGLLRSKDGKMVVNVTFVPPAKLAATAGATTLERGRNAAIRELELALHQSLAETVLVPFESARAGTWQLKAAPISRRDGQKTPFPLYVIVDLSPHTIAEINVQNSGDDKLLARQIVDGMKTTNQPDCFLPDLERMLKASDGRR